MAGPFARRPLRARRRQTFEDAQEDWAWRLVALVSV
jgi:hypothetical protein